MDASEDPCPQQKPSTPPPTDDAPPTPTPIQHHFEAPSSTRQGSLEGRDTSDDDDTFARPTVPLRTDRAASNPQRSASRHGRRSPSVGHATTPTSPHGPKSSWSAGSDISDDRVFPIRSVISVEPSARTPGPVPGSGPPDASCPTSPSELASNASRPNPFRSRGNTFSGLEWDIKPPAPITPGVTTLPGQRRDSIAGAGSLAGTGSATGSAHDTEAGPSSQPHLDEDRRGSVTDMTGPLQNLLSVSDAGSVESGALGLRGPSTERLSGSPLPSVPETDQGSASLADVPHVTTRFTHVVTEEGHSVITGHQGTLERCEDEPIHTPGAIQSFGCLVALREESDGSFVTRYVSENSLNFLGLTPKQLFQLGDFMSILSEEQQDNLLDHIDFIRDEGADPAVDGPDVFSLSVRPRKGKTMKLWCAIHINPAHPDLVICEFETIDDSEHPTRPPDEMPPPEAPPDTLHATPTVEEWGQSTEVLAKPLRIMRSARRTRGEQGAMQVFDIMSQVQDQLASAPTLDLLLKVLVGIVKELTGFHRVMIYQFDSSYNGKVVTELVDPAQTKDLYYGLNFPASDIPRQARELYKLNKVRLLYDRDLETARIVCRTREDLETPLDMSHSYLRAMSPIHIKYLAHMAVRSSMSISISPFNDLWGLVSCHSYGDHGMRVSFPIRKMCRLIGDTVSRNIERLSYASRLQARKLINTTPTDKNPSGYIIASSDDLLRLFDADLGLLSIKGETKMMGTIEQSQEALAMLEYLKMRKLTSVVSSRDFREDFPDLKYPPGFKVIAGLLYVPLSVSGNDFIVFFRKAQAKEVKWAGNPYEKIVREGTAGYLEPRSSFKAWYETVIGTCREWNEEQVETAAVLCLVYGKFIEVWRQKEQALESSKLTHLLLSNSAHEVRTPLNAIINYLEIALEGSIDKETRENLSRSYTASKSLIHVINDLLDLTKTEEGQKLVPDEVFDLLGCIEEATEPFKKDTQRKNIDYQVTRHPGLPRLVHGDSHRVRQVIHNVTANAVAYTNSGHIHVEVFVAEVRDGMAIVDFVVTDSGSGMTQSQLDSLFHDLEQVSSEDPNTPPPPDGDETARNKAIVGGRTLGLGLAIVARTVRNMDGQLRLKSDVGLGSRFVVQLPFHLVNKLPSPQLEDVQGGSISRPGSAQSPPALPHSESTGADSTGDSVANVAPASMTAARKGEIMLLDRTQVVNVATESDGSRRLSIEDRGSIRSKTSLDSVRSPGSHKSDTDRLIEAIQTPLALDDSHISHQRHRSTSTGTSRQSLPARSLSSTGVITTRRTGNATEVEDNGDKPAQPYVTPVKIPDEDVVPPPDQSIEERADTPLVLPQTQQQQQQLDEVQSRASTDLPPSVASGVTSTTNTTGAGADAGAAGTAALRVLVAEDNPINLKIMQKRLEKSGHKVDNSANGEDCHAKYQDNPDDFDVILMDMQMPIVDGLTSTQMIRAFEKEDASMATAGAAPRRIPIFAVSASLEEHRCQEYVDAGFDGWILKPVDFPRLNTLLLGIRDPDVRRSCLYEPGEWERGGWLS